MGKTVVLYVTRTGNCRTLAARVAEARGTQALEIVDLIDRSGRLGFAKAGASSARKEASPITDPGADLSGADTVVLVQPMWAFSVCPPLRTWLEAHKGELEGKRLGLLISHLGTSPEALRTKFEKEFRGLDAFTAISERLSREEKDRKLADFLAALGA